MVVVAVLPTTVVPLAAVVVPVVPTTTVPSAALGCECTHDNEDEQGEHMRELVLVASAKAPARRPRNKTARMDLCMVRAWSSLCLGRR